VGPKSDLEEATKKKPCPYWESKPRRPGRSLVITLTEITRTELNSVVS